MGAMEQRDENRDYKHWEYKEVPSSQVDIAMNMDCYESFGWEVDEVQSVNRKDGECVLLMRRDRTIANRQELTRLQRNYEDCRHQINLLRESVRARGTAVSLAVGVAGCPFAAGSVLAATAEPLNLPLCVLFAVPALLCFLLPVFLFRAVCEARRRKVEPLMEEKYDEISGLCEKGNRLLHDG